ncbi:hypothetical protein F4820DRAFT_426191 [Hypoxylon rubiginosum]|uniref:Uncharacterized protein n=1 Tax=Hypoxylon rubiginosum TaxID=110542 RepID=A0ACB9YWE8_9PEZI|nr:hypothetical protein F4820DRAFT_426191 [Hypoxylon rubiginosum]
MTCETITIGCESIEYCPSWVFKEPNNIHTITCEFFDHLPYIWMTDAPWDEQCIHCMEEFEFGAEGIAYATDEMHRFLSSTKPTPRVAVPTPDNSDNFESTSSTVITEMPTLGAFLRAHIDDIDWAADDTFGLQIRSRPTSRLGITRGTIHDFLMRRMATSKLDMASSQAVACLSAAGALRPSLDALDLQVPVPIPDGFFSYLRRFGIVTKGAPVDGSWIDDSGGLLGKLASSRSV